MPPSLYKGRMIRSRTLPRRRVVGRPFPLVLCAVVLASQGGGCAALPAATLGTLLGVTTSAVSTGSDIYRLGKLDTAGMARFDDAVGAARRAAADLCLRRKGCGRREGGSAHLAFEDAKGAKLEVRVERRTAMLVRVRVDVGLFGSEATARLFLARLRAHLPPPAFPDTAPETAPDAAAAPQDARANGPGPAG